MAASVPALSRPATDVAVALSILILSGGRGRRYRLTLNRVPSAPRPQEKGAYVPTEVPHSSSRRRRSDAVADRQGGVG